MFAQLAEHLQTKLLAIQAFTVLAKEGYCVNSIVYFFNYFFFCRLQVIISTLQIK